MTAAESMATTEDGADVSTDEKSKESTGEISWGPVEYGRIRSVVAHFALLHARRG